MSRKIVPKLKNVSGFLSRATVTYPKIADFAGRVFASARPKGQRGPAVAGQNRASRAHLTARSAYSLCQSQSLSSEQRRLPQHEPDPSALMVPLRTGSPATRLAQEEALNGRREQAHHLAKESEQRQATQRILRLMGLDFMDSEDQRGCSMNLKQGLSRCSLRLEEDRQEAKRPLAKGLGPPVTQKPKGKPLSQEATPFRPCSLDSATVLVASWCNHKSAGYPRLQEAPRSTTCGSFKLNGLLSRQQVYQPRNVPSPAYASTIAPCLKSWQPATSQPKPSHPINVVRPDIPPLCTTFPVYEKVLRVVRARDCRVELPEEEHKSRPADWVARLKRRIHF